MKLDILVVDFALVAAVFLPYLLFILIGRKEENKLKNRFLEEAKKHQLRFEEKDAWNNNIMGLDKEKARILLVQKRRAGLFAEVIDLREVRSCELFTDVHILKIEQRTEEILLSLGLHLKMRNGTVQILNLYNCEETYAQDYELKHAEKWRDIINKSVAWRPTVHSAA